MKAHWRRRWEPYTGTCITCGRSKRDHKTSDHEWRDASVDVDEWIAHSDLSLSNTRVRHATRLKSGQYDAPLPTPAERKRIREQAGLTQEDLGMQLFVTRWTISRWERPAGYIDGRRLPGREPSGELRQSYSELLRSLDRSP